MNESDNTQFTILVVDDEEVVVSLVHDALEDEGFSVVTSSDPLEAINLVESRHIDLLITDIRMPNMNGIEMARRIQDTIPELSVIFMTGYANLNSAKEAIKQGASDYIMKPFELTEIRQAVFKAIEQIQKEATVITTSEQINNLSSLNQMLFTVGDKNSLIIATLKFIHNQYKNNFCMVLSWDSAKTAFSRVTVIGENVEAEELPADELFPIIDSTNFDCLSEPVIISSKTDHPLNASCSYGYIEKYFFPACYTDETEVLIIPISRASSISGLLMIEISGKNKQISDNLKKYLQLTAHQLAMSLENIDLLDESRNAYAKLKALQDETIQLEKMATQGEMSAEIGHELNNFLGVVTGNLSLLEHQATNKQYDNLDKHIKAMTDNLGKIKKFTTNLMELRRIATKKEDLCFKQLLQEVIDYLKPQKRFQQVAIHYTPADEQGLPFKADATHIQQLLYNLFNNAADALIDVTEKKIDVTTARDNTNNTFTVTITDSGCGIDEAYLDKVFSEKFTTKEHGHGFGLVVCRRIIENHLGKLEVTSVAEKGTTITICFPLLSKETPVMQPA